MNRVQPDGVLNSEWAAFEKLADANGYGDHPDDWQPWWECFHAGWVQGCKDTRDAIENLR